MFHLNGFLAHTISPKNIINPILHQLVWEPNFPEVFMLILKSQKLTCNNICSVRPNLNQIILQPKFKGMKTACHINGEHSPYCFPCLGAKSP